MTMTDQEWADLASAYEQACGEPLQTQPPLDFGHWTIAPEDLARYAKAAVARRQPIDWREIVGPMLHERYGIDEHGKPHALS